MESAMRMSASHKKLFQGNNFHTPYTLTLEREDGEGDRPGRIVRKIEDVGASGDRGAERIVTEYGYDEAGRLARVLVNGRDTERYAYDAQGRRQHDRQAVDRFGEPGRNMSGRTWLYGRGDQLQSAGLGRGFDYDAQGRLVCERKGSGLLQWSVQVAYEALPGVQGVDLPVRLESYEPAPVNLRPTRRPANRMALGRRGAAGAQGGPGGRGRPTPILASSVDYAYDEAGCRRARRVDGEVTHVFDWHDPLRLARILDGRGCEWARFHYEGDARLPRAVSCGGTLLYLYFDHLGSLRVVADRQGNIVRCIEYESFGCVTRDTNPALYLGYGFAGGLHDPDVGTVRFWLRDYDPTLARFLTPDPAHRGETAAAGQEAGARQDAGKGQPAVDPDRYGYCLDDPVNMADETGMFLDAVSEFFGKVTDGVSEAVSGGAEAAGDAIGKTVDTFKGAWSTTKQFLGYEETTDLPITMRGDDRSFADGPKYGGWGGKRWSGGQNPSTHDGFPGDKQPVDSSDEYYRQHDTCYDGCKKDVPIVNDRKKYQERCIDGCDDVLVDSLKGLPTDPKNWDVPPEKGTEHSAHWFKKKAIGWFEDTK